MMIVYLKRLAMAGAMALFAAVQAAAAQTSAVSQPSAVGQPGAAGRPSAVGLWQKLDDHTGKSVSWFLFFKQTDATYEGVIAKYFPRPGESTNQTCSACRGELKDQPLLGLPLITGMQRDGLNYNNGTILDPRNGNKYDAMMWVSPDGRTLTVRGYLGIALFGQDETWYRLPDSDYKQLDPSVTSRYGHYLTGGMPQQGKSSTITFQERSPAPAR
jgi:uncharacterized protein (DUF2147 family)